MKKILLSLVLAGVVGTSFAYEPSNDNENWSKVSADLEIIAGALHGPTGLVAEGVAGKRLLEMVTAQTRYDQHSVVQIKGEDDHWWETSLSSLPSSAKRPVLTTLTPRPSPPTAAKVQQALVDLGEQFAAEGKINLYWNQGPNAKADAEQFLKQYGPEKNGEMIQALGTAGYMVTGSCWGCHGE